MSSLPEPEKLDEVGFEWGMKGGIGGRNRGVQFYKSFTYDGVDYAMYDCVYMYMEGEPAPYIGKLLKIWENVDKSKRIKVQWFFRPSEISYHLKDIKVLENELFFASGDGIGLANINPLEAIAGKCNVVCISTDKRNPQPSAEDLQTADYVFYRTFHVRSFTITDQIGDKVGGLEVQYLFNKRGGGGLIIPDGAKCDSNDKVEEKDVVACRETLKLRGKNSTQQLAGTNSTQQLNNVRLDANSDRALKEDGETPVMDKKQSLPRECSGADMISCKSRENTVTTMKVRNTLGVENVGCNVIGEKNEVKDINSPAIEVYVGQGVKSLRNSCNFDDALSMGAKLEGTISSLKVKDINGLQTLTVSGNDAANLVTNATTLDNAKPKSESVKGSFACRKDLKLVGNSSFLDEKMSETKSSLCKEVQGSSNGASCDKIPRPLSTNVSCDETPKLGSIKDLEGSRQAKKLVQTSTTSTSRPLKRSADFSKEKSCSGNEMSREVKDKKLVNNPCPMEQRSLKKAKFDDTIKRSVYNKDNTTKVLKKNCVGDTTNSPRLVSSHGNEVKSRLDKVTLKKSHDEKGTKLSSDDLSNPAIARPKGGGKVGGLIEVTRRPIEKSIWIKLPWEEKMKTAHNEGRLVLLHNLDPEYSSGEVEDIIWHAFEEKCTARMVQQTAISNPYSGQAFVIFVSRKAADRILQKLDDGCLMLPNQRPLVARLGVLPLSSEKQATFVGHLSVDKARRRKRLAKEAVATSHYSQNNTIEYEMAMDWRLLQLKADKWWEVLYKQQMKELKKLEENLKSKL